MFEHGIYHSDRQMSLKLEEWHSRRTQGLVAAFLGLTIIIASVLHTGRERNLNPLSLAELKIQSELGKLGEAGGFGGLDAFDMCPADYSVSTCWDFTMPVAGGYDVVSYFSLEQGGVPLIGSGDYTSQFGGMLYFFSSEKNKDTFDDDPERFVPAVGGFCTYGMANEHSTWPDIAQGYGPPSDPTQWAIMSDGKLHLFLRANAIVQSYDENGSDQATLEAAGSFYRISGAEAAGVMNSACSCWSDPECPEDVNPMMCTVCHCPTSTS